MKAITIKAPYAQLIAMGLKQFETRKTKVLHSVVGERVAIHCAQTRDVLDKLYRQLSSGETNAWHIEYALRSKWMSIDDFQDFAPQLGKVIATATIGHPRQMTGGFIAQQTPLERACGYWYAGYYAYELTDVQLLSTPVPARGNVMLWEWATEVVTAT